MVVIVGAFAIIASFQLHAWKAYAGDFIVTKADSGYSVKLRGSIKKEVPLPNSQIAFGFYEFLPDYRTDLDQTRLGFLINARNSFISRGGTRTTEPAIRSTE